MIQLVWFCWINNYLYYYALENNQNNFHFNFFFIFNIIGWIMLFIGHYFFESFLLL